jgi:hypothetical protein
LNKIFLTLPLFYNPPKEKLIMSTDSSHTQQEILIIEEVKALDPVSEVYDQILEFYITSKSLLES